MIVPTVKRENKIVANQPCIFFRLDPAPTLVRFDSFFLPVGFYRHVLHVFRRGIDSVRVRGRGKDIPTGNSGRTDAASSTEMSEIFFNCNPVMIPCGSQCLVSLDRGHRASVCPKLELSGIRGWRSCSFGNGHWYLGLSETLKMSAYPGWRRYPHQSHWRLPRLAGPVAMFSSK